MSNWSDLLQSQFCCTRSLPGGLKLNQANVDIQFWKRTLDAMLRIITWNHRGHCLFAKANADVHQCAPSERHLSLYDPISTSNSLIVTREVQSLDHYPTHEHYGSMRINVQVKLLDRGSLAMQAGLRQKFPWQG